MAPKKNKQREHLEQSRASSKAKAQESLRAYAGGAAAPATFVGFSSFAQGSTVAAATKNPLASFANAGATYHAATGAYTEDRSAVSMVYDGSDHEIAMALKMLGKKGTVTKVKALNSFLVEILPPKKAPEIRGMLGHFVQLYTYEIRDQKDRKVRQLLNEVLLLLATKLKPKAFAPHLRRLMPYWLMAMHDSNVEGAAPAMKALEALFPENQDMQAEIIVTHLESVMEEFASFFQHTPESFPGVALQDDEKEERYERCVTAAVLSLHRIIELFAATDNIDKLSDDTKQHTVASVVSSDRFGRLVSATSKNPSFSRDTIRRATYITLKELCARALPIIQAREEYFGKLILGVFSDKCPANQNDLLDAVLTFLSKVPSVWSVSESFPKFVKSAVLPRLFAQVRHGFHGSARSSLPALLPLLSFFPLEHMLDKKTGACALYSGVLENLWKFWGSSASRYYENSAIEAAFECLTAYFDIFLRSTLNGAFIEGIFGDVEGNDSFLDGYVAQFEKAMKDSFTFLFTSSAVKSNHVKLYADHLHQTMKKLASASANQKLSTKFLAKIGDWLESVLKALVTNSSVHADRVHQFLRVVEEFDLSVIGPHVYQACLVPIGQQTLSPTLLELTNVLYDVVGVSKLVGEAEAVGAHYDAHLRPVVIALGNPESPTDDRQAGAVLKAAGHFFSLADDKKQFVLTLFQDFAVQYGDMAKAIKVVQSCFQYSFSSTAAAAWLNSGSFASNKTIDGSYTDEESLTALWSGKLLDEFVMISLKGRLDALDGELFSSLLRSCLGGPSSLPVVSPDVVVILSHFVAQQTEDHHVVMRILPSLVELFVKLGNELPTELQSAEKQVFTRLFHLAATSSFKVEASSLWNEKARHAVANWASLDREEFLKSLADEINALFRGEGVSFTAKTWAAYVGVYLQLGANEGYALMKRLNVFDLKFDGTRVELTKLYDHLLACLAELSEVEDSVGRLVEYFDGLYGEDSTRAQHLLLRLIDIDVCHGLTWSILQSEMVQPKQGVDALPRDLLSLRRLYDALNGHKVASEALRDLIIDTTKFSSLHRQRRVIFTNQNSDESVNQAVDDLSDLEEAQHLELNRDVFDIVASIASTEAIEEFVHKWEEEPKAVQLVDRIAMTLKVSSDDSVEDSIPPVKRLLNVCEERVHTWPSPVGVQALQVLKLIWRTHDADKNTLSISEEPLKKLLSRLPSLFSALNPTTLSEWKDACDFLSALGSVMISHTEESSELRSRWTAAVRVVLVHPLAGKLEQSQVAALRLHKRSLTISKENDSESAIAGYSRDIVKSRQALVDLLAVLHNVGGVDLLQELATHHQEALLEVVLVALAEGLEVKAHIVSTYLGLTASESAYKLLRLALDTDALVASVTTAISVMLSTIQDTSRVKTLLVNSFGSIKTLAACFNDDYQAVTVQTRVLMYVLCTNTGVFQPSGSASAGIDINADDEVATEAALAKSIVPSGLRKALKSTFSIESKVSRGKRTRRHDHPELEEIMNSLLLWDLFLQLFPATGGNSVAMLSSALGSYATHFGLLSKYLTVTGTLISQETSGTSKLSLSDGALFEVEDLEGEKACAWLNPLEPSFVTSIAARSFFRTVMRLPAMVRAWWNDECGRGLRSWASKYFEEHITPYVLASELAIIQKASSLNSWDIDEMTVKGSKVSREITTTYMKDECALEMVIRVPSSYPLRSVEVECTRRIGISEDRWRRWVLQIIKVTSAQDGSLLDAVLLWKQNVDKEFEGVEPCPICYSILNPKTMGLPNLSCKTCSNKYHNSCLYKWFNQSGKNKCPICQQPFT